MEIKTILAVRQYAFDGAMLISECKVIILER